jgi:hypothetical protein
MILPSFEGGYRGSYLLLCCAYELLLFNVLIPIYMNVVPLLDCEHSKKLQNVSKMLCDCGANAM